MFDPAANAGTAASVAPMQAKIAATEVREDIMDELPL
jgi:hypothetical protein